MKGEAKTNALRDFWVDVTPRVFSTKGGGKLEVTGAGFIFRRKNGAVFSTAHWGQLRELKNMIRTKGWFSYRGDYRILGMETKASLIRVAVVKDPSEWEQLAAIFDQLPPELSAKKCSVCSGLVINGVCGDCGRSFRAVHRKRGLYIFLGGIVAEVLGIGLTIGSESGGSFKVYIYLILLGFIMMILGLVGLIFGVRILEFNKKKTPRTQT